MAIFKKELAMIIITIITFKEVKIDLERYFNTGISDWVTLIGTLKTVKQSSLSCMVVTG